MSVDALEIAAAGLANRHAPPIAAPRNATATPATRRVRPARRRTWRYRAVVPRLRTGLRPPASSGDAP